MNYLEAHNETRWREGRTMDIIIPICCKKKMRAFAFDNSIIHSCYFQCKNPKCMKIARGYESE